MKNRELWSLEGPGPRLPAAALLTLGLLQAFAGSGCIGEGESTSSGSPGGGGASSNGGGGAGAAGSGAAELGGFGTGASGEGGALVGGNGGEGGSGGAPAPCATFITYGDRWIHPPGAAGNLDVVAGLVTWDGQCFADGANSYAVLSNGWTPYFEGRGCAIALDLGGDCGVPMGSCETRFTYGPSWQPPPNHPDDYDDVGGAAFSDGRCVSAGGGLVRTGLSNGWVPHFAGSECDLSVRWSQCGGLYQNPVVPTDCPDPGVLKDGDDYYMVCTKSDFFGLFTIHHSKDLVHFEEMGHVFEATSPSWSVGDYWAPELHAVDGGYVAYFSARTTGGRLAIGAAYADAPGGPYTDIGAPLVDEAAVGQIDAHSFVDAGGQRYLVWKDDGNSVGQSTPIWGQRLSADGLTRMGAKTQLITNTLGWEGALVEGPWIVERGGDYYLFYSGNAYYDGRYALGVARADAPLGPYTKLGGPILATGGAFAGPGHGSVVVGPHGDDVLVYHAWLASSIGGAPGRVTLVDRLQWNSGVPSLIGAPSNHSRPAP